MDEDKTRNILVLTIKSEELEEYSEKEVEIITNFLTYLADTVDRTPMVSMPEECLYSAVGGFIACALSLKYLNTEEVNRVQDFFKEKFTSNMQMEQ